jgi:hypothetical protein
LSFHFKGGKRNVIVAGILLLSDISQHMIADLSANQEKYLLKPQTLTRKNR